MFYVRGYIFGVRAPLEIVYPIILFVMVNVVDVWFRLGVHDPRFGHETVDAETLSVDADLKIARSRETGNLPRCVLYATVIGYFYA
jgi:hypothetical protein